MKLLLTSGGITNESMVSALRELLGKDFAEAKLVFIPTAANVEAGDKWWLIEDLRKCKELGFKEVDIVDIAAVSEEVWRPRFENTDILLFSGGNTSYLMGQIKKSGLAKALPELLQKRVYVGISAGSMVVAPNLYETETARLYNEPILDPGANIALGFVDFLVIPHLNSAHFPTVAERIGEVAKDISTPLYVIDDQTAVKVVDDKVEVISEGEWRRLN